MLLHLEQPLLSGQVPRLYLALGSNRVHSVEGTPPRREFRNLPITSAPPQRLPWPLVPALLPAAP